MHGRDIYTAWIALWAVLWIGLHAQRVNAAPGDVLDVRQAGGDGLDSPVATVWDETNDVYYVAGFYSDGAVFGAGEPNETTLSSQGGTDCFLAQFTPSGDLNWVVTGGGPGPDTPFDIALAPGGTAIYLVGSFNDNATFGTESVVSAGEADLFIAKYDAQGTFIGITSAGSADTTYGDAALAAAVDETTGNLFVAGVHADGATFPGPTPITLSSRGELDVFYGLYDGSTLSPLWLRTAGGPLTDSPSDVGLTADGTFVVAGVFRDTAVFDETVNPATSLTSRGEADVFLLAGSTSNSFSWVEQAGGAGDDAAGRLDLMPLLGDAFLTGAFASTATFGTDSSTTTLTAQGDSDIFVARYSRNGRLQWVRGAGGTGANGGAAISLRDLTGSTVVTGTFSGRATFGAGESNETTLDGGLLSGPAIFVASYTPLGALEWAIMGKGNLDADPLVRSGSDLAVRSTANETLMVGAFFNKVTYNGGTTNELVQTSRGSLDMTMARIANAPPAVPLCGTTCILLVLFGLAFGLPLGPRPPR